MAGNTLTLDFAGDAKKLQAASKDATKAVDDVAAAAKSAGGDFDTAAKESGNLNDRMGSLGAGVSGATDAIESAGAATQALADFQSAGVEKAARLARASNDVKQAQEDLAQATRDGAQATIDAGQAELDLEQARLDQTTALEDYNAAVKEHGAGSTEARQASIDLKQAGIDVTQAQEDAAQATRDAAQANIDAEAAQLDMNDAMREANPPQLQQWADQINLITPLLSAVVGIVALVTAAQWAWNAAQLASPTTWIILAIAALIAIVVLLVVHWDKVKKAGAAAWRWIKDAAADTWNWMKKIPGWIGSAFKNIARVISAPYRAAFNMISSAWNNTIGRLSWTVPGWIPGIGGMHISVPQLPKFHRGGVVPGAPGTEVPIMALAGETVTPAGGGTVLEIRSGGSALDDLLVEILSNAVRVRGGNVQLVLGGRNA